MTRFARAKGSKASNEKLPEQATSWSEMKQELLNKNKEIEEQKGREEALKKRQANYKAFLQEKEEEEDKKIAWADFPEANKSVSNGKLSNNKRKVGESLNGTNKKIKGLEEDSEDSDGQFSALKLQIDRALDKQNNDNAEEFQEVEDSEDSDAAPEEVSVKQKPQEIVVKKSKKVNKQKLKIVVDKSKEENLESKSEANNKPKEDKVLTEKEQKLVVKKQERYKRQLEKKKLRKQQNLNGNPAPEGPKKVETREEIEAAKLERKLARREKQKEKRRLGRMQKAEENKPKLSEEELKKIEKKREKKIKQIEKRQKFKEATKVEDNNKEANDNGNVKFSEQEQKSFQQINKKPNKTFNGNNESRQFNEQVEQKSFQQINREPNKTFNGNNDNRQFNEQLEQKPFQQPPKKPAKPRDNRNHESRKQKPEIMYINGKTVDVDYVDGFPVKKEDADRLKQLRKEMISKGLPRSEINVALKLERRRAEKAFAREKKNVCFNCRKSGHNLSECPELGKDQALTQTAGTGICFKCGSTEHTHFECKVVRGMDYKFATCFICKEQGHISRQCPDNQRGLYPKGGSCKVCGDVTHLKKDCPKYQMQQSQLQSSLSIGTIDNGNPDDDFDRIKGANNNNNNAGFVSRKANKVVKF